MLAFLILLAPLGVTAAYIATSPFDRWSLSTTPAIDGINLEAPAVVATSANSVETYFVTYTLVRVSPSTESSLTIKVAHTSTTTTEAGKVPLSTLMPSPVTYGRGIFDNLTIATGSKMLSIVTLPSNLKSSATVHSAVNGVKTALGTATPAMAVSQASVQNISLAVPVTLAFGTFFLAWAFIAE